MEQLLQQFTVFLLIFIRVSAFFVTLPLFSYRTLPAIFRIGFAFFLAILIHLSLDYPAIAINGQYFLLIMKEALVGLLIGFLAYMLMATIQIAGGFIDFQMGFAIANVIDPQTGAQTPIIGQYFYTFALLALLAVNGHHLILDGVFYSYQFIPLDQVGIAFGDVGLITYVSKTFAMIFMIAFQMAIPVVAVLFLVDVALGILARTVPQLNVFVVGFPIKIAVSFLVIFIVFGVIFGLVEQLFETIAYAMRDAMERLGGQR